MESFSSPNELEKNHADGRCREASVPGTLLSMDLSKPEVNMTVLIAIEPRAYRQTIGYTVQALRPSYVVEVVDPDRLRAEVARRIPEVVLCSLSRTGMSDGGPTWVDFRPYAGPAGSISVDGEDLGLEAVELADLLSILDEAESTHHFARAGS